MEAEGYAGVAFAESNKMLDGDVYICQKSSKFGQFPVLKTHWIHDRAYPFLTANLDQIESYLNDYRYFLDGKNQSGKDSYARIISCGFRRPLELEDLGQFKFSKYNLLQSDFYMLIAHGAMETNPAKKRDIGYHSGDKNMRSSSSDKIWFTPDGKPSPEYLLRIADKNETWHQVIDNRDAKIRNLLLSHGILMIIAWLFLINLNKFIVRNCQKLGCQFFDQNKKNVYYFHVGVNILAIILVTLAVILSFAGSNWKFIGTSSESTYASVHGIVGIVILAAVYFQMILGFLKKLPLKMALQPKAEVVTQKSNYSPMSKMDEQVTQDSQISGEEVTQLGEANQENFEAQKTPKKNSSRPTGKMGTSLNLKVFNVIKLVHAVFGHSVSILAGLNVILGLFLFQNRVSWVFVLRDF